jgi:hypothetical protein
VGWLKAVASAATIAEPTNQMASAFDRVENFAWARRILAPSAKNHCVGKKIAMEVPE